MTTAKKIGRWENDKKREDGNFEWNIGKKGF